MARQAGGSGSRAEEDESDIYLDRTRGSPQRNSASDVFTVGGRPARFHLYTAGFGALTPGQVEALSEKIEAHGGEIVEKEEESDTIIVQYVGVDELRAKYWDSRTVWVEEANLVQLCINTGKYMENLQKPIRKGMGGRPEGSRRVAFTAEDDEHLIEFLAHVVPDKDGGGRGGREIYRRLMVSGQQFERRNWALRHTMWSWRERYKIKKADMDPMIERVVEESPPPPDGKGLYERNRRLNPKARHLQEGTDSDGEEEEEEEEEVEVAIENQGTHTNSRKRRLSQRDTDDFESRRDKERRPSMNPKKRARHTDAGVPMVSPVERARGTQRPQSFPQPGQAPRRSLSISDDETNLPFELPTDDEADLGEDNWLPFEPESDTELPTYSRRPGPEDAGPSGTQRTPTSSPAQVGKTSSASRTKDSRSEKQTRHRRPHSRPTYAGASGATHGQPRHSQVPMSSQATLIGTAPTQARREQMDSDNEESMYGGPTQVQQDESAPARVATGSSQSISRHLVVNPEQRPIPNEGPNPSQQARKAAGTANSAKDATAPPVARKRATKGKRIMVVEIPPVAGLFPQAAARSPAQISRSAASTRPHSSGAPSRSPNISKSVNARRPTVEQHFSHESVREEAQHAPVDELLDLDEVAGPVDGGEVLEEDDEEVEDLIMISNGTSNQEGPASLISGAARRDSHPFEEELDSDDQRTHQSLVSTINVQRHIRNLRAAGSLSMRSTASTGSAGKAISVHSDDSADEAPAPTVNVSRRSTSHLRPSLSQRLQGGSAAQASRVSSSKRQYPLTPVGPRNGSMTSDTDSVPMPGTRAREEKIRIEEEQRKTPYTPPAGTRAAATLTLRTRDVLRTTRTKVRR